jgi:DnaJ-class molecular chaperone
VKNYYEILGVSEDATTAEIKKAYRTLAKEWHPDRSDHPQAKEKFQEINEANAVLSNSQKRQEYDTQRRFGSVFEHQDSGFGPFNTDDLGSIFGDIFGGGFRRPRRQQQNVFSVQCTLEDVYGGVQKNVNGKLVNIPAGTRHGTLFQANNTLFKVSVVPHERFHRQNDDLYIELHINVFDAMLGTTADIRHLNGDKYTLKVPQGTQPEQMLRIKGKGMPNPEINNAVGDLYVVCKIYVPADLTEEQKQVIITNIYSPKQYTV